MVSGTEKIVPEGTSAPKSEPRNLSLDGLRGFSILVVFFYHHGYLNSGWFGVDFFFVLSGYLITRIIWRTREDAFFWRRFWVKRATRILPPLLIALCIAALFSLDLTIGQATAYLLSFGDVMAYKRPTYEALRPLWSLAVEEHFYIFWPFAVRGLSRQWLVRVLCGLILIEPLARAVAICVVRDWQFVYFLTPFRLDGLALGCLLALVLDSREVRERVKRWSGVAAVVVACVWLALRIGFGLDFTRDNPTMIYNGACYSLIAMFACCIIASMLTNPGSWLARIFSWKPLVFLGSISYGLYLYHVLVKEIVVRELHLEMGRAILLTIPISLTLAWISFRFCESPLIGWGRAVADRFGRSTSVKA